MKTLLLCLILSLPLSSFAASIQIDNVRSVDGFIAVSIFSEENQASYPTRLQNATQTYYVPIQEKDSVVIQLKGLPVGKYAITLMHDEDGDGQLKKGPMGVPREGFGFSNNPRVYFGAPDFDKVVTPIRKDTVVKVTMKYLL